MKNADVILIASLSLFAWSLGCAGDGCKPSDEFLCIDGDLYLVDSCGNVGEMIRECAHGCADGDTNCCDVNCEGKCCGDDGCGGQCGPGCEDPTLICNEDSCLCEESLEVEDGVYLMRGTARDLPIDDLAPLSETIGDASYVGLGESVHTSGGYYQTKARLFQYLVEHEGFRAYAMETPWYEASIASEYVATCQGTALDAVASVFWVFQDVSFMETLEWMCQWNQAHPDDPVFFFGWDIQQPWDDGRLLYDFLQAAAPDQADALYEGIDPCLGVGYADVYDFYASEEAAFMNEGTNPPSQPHLDCIQGLAALRDYFEINEQALIDATSQEQMQWAWISLVGVESYEDELFYFNSDVATSYEARDAGNAYTIPAIRELVCPDKKVVIWAHNWHLASNADLWHGYGENKIRIDGWYQGAKSTGTFLEEQLGDDYVAIGILGYEVHIDWGDYQDPPIPTNENAVEVMLHALGHPMLFVDLRREDGNTFFDMERDYQMAMEWMVPAEQYDAMVFLDLAGGMDHAL